MKHLRRGPRPLKSTWTPKLCTIGHENGQKCPKSQVFYDFVKLVWRGSWPFKSTPDQKTMCYSPRKQAEMPEIKKFSRFCWNSCHGVPDLWNPPRTVKLCAIAQENGQKSPKSPVFSDFVKHVRRVPDSINTPGPKTVCYSPQKQAYMLINHDFLQNPESRVTGSLTV